MSPPPPLSPRQLAFMEELADRVPQLFEVIRNGHVHAEWILGQRTIDARQVRLKLVAEVVDPGANPLQSHSSGATDTQAQ